VTTQERPLARYVRPGELLAMDPARLRRGDTGAFFWLMGAGPKPNERKGDVAIVHIRGELEHHADAWGSCESYEGIIERMQAAISGQDCADQHEAEHRSEADYKPIEASPPSSIIVSIDSPGGVVAGLNETVRSLRKLVKSHPEIQFCVWVNEMAASAAYALACAFPEIICPRSAILGSIGVISTMISQARKNQKDGYDVRLLTSGARKADGHLHAPISDDAVTVEMDRVEKLAMSFWKLAGKARGLSIEKVRSFEAGIFLGPDAVKRQLADSIMSFDDLLLGANSAPREPTTAGAQGGNETDRRVSSSTKVSMRPPFTEAVMPIALSALIKKTEAAIAKEKDPKKLASLALSLQAYKKTEKHIEHQSTEEGDEGDEDDEDKDVDDEDEDEKSAAPPMKKDEKSAAADKDDEDEEEEESEESSAKAALKLVSEITGMKGKKALGALQAIAATAASTARDVADLKKTQRLNDKSALIETARAKSQITKSEAKWLGGEKLATVQGFIETRQKSGFVHTDENTLVRPKHVTPGTEESLPQEARKMIEESVANFPGDKRAFREQLVKAHLESHSKQLTAALNGAGRI
jgi:ClpP class serine protease